MIVFFVLLFGITNATTNEASTAIESASVENVTSIGVYFAGIIGIILSLGLGYGLKRIYDVRRES